MVNAAPVVAAPIGQPRTRRLAFKLRPWEPGDEAASWLESILKGLSTSLMRLIRWFNEKKSKADYVSA